MYFFFAFLCSILHSLFFFKNQLQNVLLLRLTINDEEYIKKIWS